MPGLYNKYIKPLHAFGDAVSIVLSSVVAFQLTHGLTAVSFRYFLPQFILYALLAWYICTYLLGTYQFYRIVHFKNVAVSVLKVMLLYLLLIEALSNVIELEAVTRDFLLYHYAILAVCVVLYRIIVLASLRYFRKKGYNKRYVIIVGMGKAGKELRKYFNTHPEYGYHFIGYFDDNTVNDPDKLGTIDELENYLEHNYIDDIYCSSFELNRNQVIRIMNYADDHLIRMKFLPEPSALPQNKLKIDFYDMLPVLVSRSIPLDDIVNKAIKRAFDIAFSSIVIVFFLSWFIPIIAILIKIDSRGPVFYGQERSGINYKTFRCWKFRSMYVNSESQLAKRGDSRITRMGAFIRKTSLDELPQFFNVFMGHMSIVGPRPHPLFVNEEYAMVAEKYMVRHFIKPGITGLSQVRGYRGDTSSDYQIRGRVKLDIFYLENWSFFLDLKIVFYTVYNMLRGEDNAF
ncbi:undecaprenyl-phosphate glucose phosphotransferase [Pontibacter ramchanderi]|uniref:Putative colanic acid biosynthesis UDP-glucose lipid carrier transferase n=1 Tax=Pontibacter ramchanderi TaxID=1179743 RepID=A0A2N3U7N3_9BACT|nr:undecaprenyl-phosphate glucose phosphotransferase [Pontibacter ramchanderi]PKV62735.1 putative colanic acid biosynthesis UDP-glucose lipid carrier transferase [Pontibacter ramchanderi]